MATSTSPSAGNIEFGGDQPGGAIGSRWQSGAERRQRYRYPLDLGVRFRCPAGESCVSGHGLAVNLSSGGVLVASRHQMNVGARVEMSIEWPLLLDGKTPLQLLAVGWVLRRGDFHFAATFDRYEFRTLKSSS